MANGYQNFFLTKIQYIMQVISLLSCLKLANGTCIFHFFWVKCI